MRKIIIFLLCFIMFVNYNEVDAQGEFHILGLGDSITSGYGVTQNNYVQIVYNYMVKKYSEKNVILDNEAINGLQSHELLTNIKNDSTIQKKIEEANLIVLSIGGNDYLNELTKSMGYLYNKESTFIQIGENMLDNSKSIYDNIYNLNSDVVLIVIPLYNPYVVLLKSNQKLIKIYNQTKEDFIKQTNDYNTENKRKIYTLPNLAQQLENDNYLNTGIDPHPNNNGHKLIGEECINLIKEIYIEPTSNNNISKDIKKEKFFNKYKYYLIALGIILIALIFKKSYNNARK